VIDKRVPPLWEARPADFPLATFVLDHATGSSSTRSSCATRPAPPGTRGRSASFRIQLGLFRPSSRSASHEASSSAVSVSATRARGSRSSSDRSQRHGAGSRSSCCSSSDRRRRASTSIAGCSGSAWTTRGWFATGGWTRRSSGRSWPEAMSS
jgi:hypothetical protein